MAEGREGTTTHKIMPRAGVPAPPANAEREVDLLRRQLRRQEAILRAVRSINDLLVHSAAPEQVARGVCENLVRSRAYAQAWILLFDSDGHVAYEASSAMDAPAWRDFVHRVHNGYRPVCVERIIETGESVSLSDLAGTCAGCPLSPRNPKAGGMIHGLWNNRHIYGVVGVTVSRRLADDPNERELFAETAGSIAFALHKLHLDLEQERAQARQEQTEALLYQAQKMEPIGQLTGGVAHDFNNILTAIIGYAEMLKDELDSMGAPVEKIEVIREAADQASNLTSQLLAFSRLDTAGETQVDLRRVVQEAQRLLVRILGEDVTLSVRTAGEPVCVRAGYTPLVQVLLNLAVNARDAMPTGGRLVVDVGYEETGGQASPAGRALLRVSDDGEGIEPEVREHLFDPFFTTKEEGRGTGLGLCTVKSIVERYEGEIRIISEPGHGSSFEVLLPACEEAADAEEEDSSLPAPSGGEVVLVVEDQADVRQLACDILRLQGYTVLEADGAKDAMFFAERYSGTIDLLLTDIVMPECSGVKLHQMLTAKRPDVATLFMTGYADETVRQHGANAAQGPILRKPFSRSELLAQVHSVLAARRNDAATGPGSATEGETRGGSTGLIDEGETP